MLTLIFNFIFKLIAHCPLWLLHGLGFVLGWLVYALDRRYRGLLRGQLRGSGVVAPASYAATLRSAIAHSGKGLAELAVAWGRPAEAIASLVRSCEGWEHVEAAQAAGRALIFVTPHLGSFDIAGRYVSTRLSTPLTALYRPPKLAILAPLMEAGRVRDKGRTAPASAAGVRILLKALKHGEATVILPDQAPGAGEGVWAPFFGRPAYTMTLLPRLATASNAAVLFFFAERLSFGRGFSVHIVPMQGVFSGDKAADARLLNQQIESLIARCPEQYLWSYNRYKQPAGAAAPEENT